MDEIDVNSRFDDEAAQDEAHIEVDEYDLTSSPNDFNIATITSYIDAHTITIPGFQRNYVWDIKRASRLIESVVIGLPVPQLFMYEESRNKFIVIDGQQRLMSIYYFKKGRFPRKDKRAQIRQRVLEEDGFSNALFSDDELFQSFRLSLPSRPEGRPNPLNGLAYDTLQDYQQQFDLRPLRVIVIKQNVPAGDNSSVFEIFHRLNTGGVNLAPQEIRASLYHSDFMDALSVLNREPRWRSLIGLPEPDLHLKDIETLLRGFAMLDRGHNYKPSMAKFLNDFARDAKGFGDGEIDALAEILELFLASLERTDDDVLLNPAGNKFSVPLFEAVFRVVAENVRQAGAAVPVTAGSIRDIANDPDFILAASRASADAANVKTRYNVAKRIIG